MTTLYIPNDDVLGLQLAANYVAGSGTMTLKAGQGARLTALPTLITVVVNADYQTGTGELGNKASYVVSAVAGDVLTVAVAAGSTDRNFSINDYVDCRPGAPYLTALNAAIAALQSATITVTAGTGLAGGGSPAPGGSVSLSIAAGGVGTAQLAAGAVTAAKIAPGTANELMGFDGSGNPTSIAAGGGITISGGVISATAGGGGTVTSVSVASANGFAGTVATATTTPAITITTTVAGLLKGNGTAISAATAGTDYVTPSGNITGTAANVTGVVSASNGGTGLSTYATGDMLYAGGATAIARLAGNTSATRQFLTGTGTGTAANAPAWATIAAADLPTVGLNITSHHGTITTDADGATVTFDLSVSDWHTVTLGGNRTLALSNPTVGQQFTLFLQQDATGSRTVTWFAGIRWAGGTAPTLTTTPSKGDLFTFKCIGAGSYLGVAAGLNF